MSRLQREELDAQLRASTAPAPQTVEGLRTWFADMMATMEIPNGLRTAEARLGGSRAVRVEASHELRPGTILYFHGGSWIMGSPETAMSLTGNGRPRSIPKARFCPAAAEDMQ